MKKNLLTNLAPFLSLSTILSSCFVAGPYDPYIVDLDRQKENSYHSSSSLHAPMLSKKNDVSFAGHYAFLSRHNGIELQTAFMPSNHVGIKGSFRSHWQKGDVESGKIESFEIGAGYVKDWSNFLFEAYAGIEGGVVDNKHYTGYSDIGFRSYYIQPAFAFQNKKKTTQIALVMKLSPTKFKIRDTTFTGEREPFVTEQFRIIANEPNRIFLEPGFVFRAGSENVLFQTALSFPTNLSGKDFLRDKSNFSIGLIYRFNATQK